MKKLNYTVTLFFILCSLFSCSNQFEEEYQPENMASKNVTDSPTSNLRAASPDYPDIAVNPVGKFFWWRSMDDAKHLFSIQYKTSIVGWTDKFEDWVFRTLPFAANNNPKWFEIMKNHIVVVNRYLEKSTGAYRLVNANESVYTSQYTLLENLGSVFNKQIPGTEPIYEYISDRHKDYIYMQLVLVRKNGWMKKNPIIDILIKY